MRWLNVDVPRQKSEKKSATFRIWNKFSEGGREVAGQAVPLFLEIPQSS